VTCFRDHPDVAMASGDVVFVDADGPVAGPCSRVAPLDYTLVLKAAWEAGSRRPARAERGTRRRGYSAVLATIAGAMRRHAVHCDE
jgi:hypothetical protein